MNNLKFRIKNQSGSLLMNVLIFVGIATLLTLISIPYLRKYQPNLKLMATARDMTSDLRYAQQLTITEQITHIVQMNMETKSYQILKLDTATSTIKTVNFPTELSYYAINNLTGNKVVFNSYGGVSEAGEIIITNTNNKQAKINVKPSGYIQLEQ